MFLQNVSCQTAWAHDPEDGRRVTEIDVHNEIKKIPQ
jgi:hypothetical protein